MDLRSSHLLALDADLEASDVLALVRSRHPQLDPLEATALIPGADLLGARTWRLSRNSRLTGPVPLSPEDRGQLSLPEEASAVFALHCPRDREPAPPPEWYRDQDHLHEAFPDGLPNREEGRMLDLLIAIAKRLHLWVRLADEPSRPGVLLTPDPGLTVDHYVYSPYWLSPEVLLEQLRTVEPGAALPEVELAPDPGAEGPVVLDGYSVLVDLGDISPAAGTVEVRVMLAEVVPQAVRGGVPAEQQFVEYHLHWMDAEQRRFQSPPAPGFTAVREAAAARVERLARVILLSTAGVAVDEGGFLVAAGQLGGEAEESAETP